MRRKSKRNTRETESESENERIVFRRREREAGTEREEKGMTSSSISAGNNKSDLFSLLIIFFHLFYPSLT